MHGVSEALWFQMSIYSHPAAGTKGIQFCDFIIFLFEIYDCFNSMEFTVLRSAVFHVIWFIKKLCWHFVISH